MVRWFLGALAAASAFAAVPAVAQCVGGANGTPQTPAYLLSNEFQDGRPAGSITPACLRDLIASTAVLNGINARTASYTLALSDVGKLVTMNVAGDSTLTVPTNASVAIPIGSKTWVRNIGAFANTNRLTIASGSVGSPQIDTGGSWTMTDARQEWVLTKIATNEWTLTGNTPKLLSSDYSLTTTDGGGAGSSGAGVSQYWGVIASPAGAFACGASTFDVTRIVTTTTGGPTNGPYRTLNVVAADNWGGFGLRCQMGALEWRFGDSYRPQWIGVVSGSFVSNNQYAFAIFHEGDHKITEFDIRLPSNWPMTANSGFQLVAQWKQCQPNTSVATSPTIELDQYNSQWIILSDPSSGSVSKYTSSNVSLSTWYHIKLDAYFSQQATLGWIQLSTQALGSTPQLSGLIAMKTLQQESGASDLIPQGASVPACLLVGPYARSTMPTTSLDMTNFQVWDAN